MKLKIPFVVLAYLAGFSVNARQHISQLPKFDSVQLKFVEISKDITLEYAEQGAENSQTVIFLHGFLDSWRSYEHVLKHLPEHFRGIAISQRGFGNSSKEGTSFTPALLASDVFLFMEKLNIEKAIIVGHSMGSVVAQKFAINHPEKTQALVLIGAFYHLATNTVAAELEKEVNGFTTAPSREYVEAFQKSTLALKIDEEYFTNLVNESMKAPLHVWKSALRGLVQTDLRAEHRRIICPVIIFWGKMDAVCSEEEQVALLKSLPSAELKTYLRSGHSPHWEETIRFNKDLNEFLNKIFIQ